LNESWDAQVLNQPPGVVGLGFKTSLPASGVVYKDMDPDNSPVFIWSIGTHPMVPGTYDIVPTGNIKVFFATNEPGTVFDSTKAHPAGLSFSYLGSSSPEIKIMRMDSYQILTNSQGRTFTYLYWKVYAEDTIENFSYTRQGMHRSVGATNDVAPWRCLVALMDDKAFEIRI
jgi:hypothetical protein